MSLMHAWYKFTADSSAVTPILPTSVWQNAINNLKACKWNGRTTVLTDCQAFHSVHKKKQVTSSTLSQCEQSYCKATTNKATTNKLQNTNRTSSLFYLSSSACESHHASEGLVPAYIYRYSQLLFHQDMHANSCIWFVFHKFIKDVSKHVSCMSTDRWSIIAVHRARPHNHVCMHALISSYRCQQALLHACCRLILQLLLYCIYILHTYRA